MNTKNAVKMSITLLCLAASAGSLYNVNSDIGPLQAQAEAIACPKKCASLRALSRTPFAQTFTFQLGAGAARTATVKCARSWVFLGAYECERASP